MNASTLFVLLKHIMLSVWEFSQSWCMCVFESLTSTDEYLLFVCVHAHRLCVYIHNLICIYTYIHNLICLAEKLSQHRVRRYHCCSSWWHYQQTTLYQNLLLQGNCPCTDLLASRRSYRLLHSRGRRGVDVVQRVVQRSSRVVSRSNSVDRVV